MKNALIASASVIALAAITMFSSSAEAAPYPDGNLWGAAQVCGLSTNGLAYSNDPGFQSALQNALRSRQDCGQVANTVYSAGSQGSYNSTYQGQNTYLNRGYANPNYGQYGNPNYSQYGNSNYGQYGNSNYPRSAPYSKNYHHDHDHDYDHDRNYGNNREYNR